MGGGIGHLVLSGPLILAVPVAAAARAVTFLSPCVLPLVSGPTSYVARHVRSGCTGLPHRRGWPGRDGQHGRGR